VSIPRGVMEDGSNKGATEYAISLNPFRRRPLPLTNCLSLPLVEEHLQLLYLSRSPVFRSTFTKLPRPENTLSRLLPATITDYEIVSSLGSDLFHASDNLFLHTSSIYRTTLSILPQPLVAVIGPRFLCIFMAQSCPLPSNLSYL
jgi:hypothetical protein